jgi:purine-nucleoside phosphorylase
VEIEQSVSYDDIPHFPTSTVESHSGNLIFGKLNGTKVIVMQGRFHYYEGYSMQQIASPVRVMKLLGITNLFVSNAAGGLNPAYDVSDLMIIHDHISLLPDNPLIGKNMDDLGPRFPDMSEPYDFGVINESMEFARLNGITLHKGVYVSVPGPNLETRAEYKYLRLIGADVVGMSTIPEIIAARHMGLKCCAISVVTDMCIPDLLKEAKLEYILAAAAKAEPNLTKLIGHLVSRA